MKEWQDEEAEIKSLDPDEIFYDAVAEPMSIEVSQEQNPLGAVRWREEDHKIFKQIDRTKENELVDLYQKTKNIDIFEELYKMRTPTLWVWAKRFAYLSDEVNMFGEFRRMWLKAIEHYDINPKMRDVRDEKGNLVLDEKGQPKKAMRSTPFNSLLFTYLDHHRINLYKFQRSKKRCDPNGVPMDKVMRSLHEPVGKDGEEKAMLMDTIADPNVASAAEHVGADWLIDQVAGDDEEVRELLKRFAYEGEGDLVSQTCFIRRGKVRLSHADRQLFWLGGEEAEERLIKLIEDTGKYPHGFRLKGYTTFKGHIEYEVTAGSDLLERVFSAFRKVRPSLAADLSKLNRQFV